MGIASHVPFDVNMTAEVRAFLDDLDKSLQDLTSLHSREVLTAARTYYVSNAGSNSTGDGSSAKPWQTIQFAADFATNNIDTGTFAVTVQLADGTYAPAFLSAVPGVGAGAGTLKIQGNLADPSLVIVNDDGYACLDMITAGAAVYESLTFAPINGGNAVIIDNGNAIVAANNCVYAGGAGAARTFLGQGAFSSFFITGTSKLSGNWNTIYQGSQPTLFFTSGTMTIVGTPNFVDWANMLSGKMIDQTTYINGASAVGERYNISQNGVIDSTGGGVNKFPGNAAGVTSSGGVYV